jgi:predicted O-methyltransferase YrrM
VKDRADAILQTAQAAYLESLLPRRDALLREIEVYAAAEDIPISDPEVGLTLQILVGATGARRVLEVGSAIGYGSIWMARGGADTQVVAIERDPARIARARGYLERAQVADRVRILEGDALELVRGLEGPFDLIYLDSEKKDYRRLLDFSLQLLRLGGLVVIDNLLWKGQVADPPEDDEDEQAEVLRMFNAYLSIHPQVDSLVLPLADGLGVAIKKKPLVTDLGGPY